MAECTRPACEVTNFHDLKRRERVHIRGDDPTCPVHHGHEAPLRDVYVGKDGKHYPSRAEAGWNER